MSNWPRGHNWSTDINEESDATFVVDFTNGSRQTIKMERTVVDTRGFPMWFDAVDGTRYNYQNIISLKKVSNAGN